MPEKDRTKPPPQGFFRWILPTFKTSNEELISKCGLDAYFFLRYLRMLLKIFLPAALVILPILLPINTNYNGGLLVQGLDKLGWQNYDPEHTNRLWAHLVLAVLLLLWVCYVIFEELSGYIRVRQAYLTSPQHRLRASATTVLVTSISQKWLTYEALDSLFDVFPGGVRNIWINRNFDELNDKVKLRNKLAKKLEGAETELIRKATKMEMKLKAKREKEAGMKYAGVGKRKLKQQQERTTEQMTAKPGLSSGDKGFDTEPEWKKYLSEKDRDTMRLPLFGLLNWLPFMPSWTFIGKKVDTIYYCRKEVARLNLEIEKDQQEPEKYPLMNSAFIQFNRQVAAHMACQSLSHHSPNHMTPRVVEVAPGDVIWDNLSIRWWERLLRLIIVIVLITGLVILWTIPVSFTSAISTLSTLATYKGFTWINKMPKWLETALSGILPPLLANALLGLLPIFLGLAAKQEGAPTGMSVELIVQDMYFAFSFVQLFLVVTISTSILKVISQISNRPTSTVGILAQNIPKASNYFFSYMTLQALSVSAGSLAQIPTLALWFLWRPIKDNTARQKFQRQLNLPTVSWGSFFPVYTNLACIGLIYSIIAPLIMVFNIITWTLFWIVFRYQTLYVNVSKFDTGGLLFPKAVNQLFTGIYVMELALIGLFLLVQDSKQQLSCLPQAVIMVVILFFTVLYQLLITTTFKPLYRYIPITLEDDAVKRDEEFERIQAQRWQIGPSQQEDEQQFKEQELRDVERREHSSIAINHSQDDTSSNRRSEIAPDSDVKQAETERNSNCDGKSPTSRDSIVSGNEQTNTSNLGPIPPSWRRRHRLTSKIPTVRFRTALDQNLDPETAGQPSVMNSLLHARNHNVGDALFGHFVDTIEDLTAAERDTLVQRAFYHEALRARRPVIWIPRDDLGVSDDEIRRTNACCGDNVWINNEYTSLDSKGRVMFGRAPPDFSEVDLIEL